VITVALPSEERRALVRAFWLTISGLTALPWLAVAWWAHEPVFALAGAVAAVLIGFVNSIREGFVWRVYRAWNRRLVQPFVSTASRVVIAVCFFVILVAVGRAGSRMRLAVGGGASTSWASRTSLARETYRTLFAEAFSGRADAGWIANYWRWATQTGNFWAVSLLPFLAVLKLLTGEEEKAVQANIYTLF
jgi:hypothetical protein